MYRRKRDFSRSAEPTGDQKPTAGRAVFVVQLHHASTRHFDFRLQIGDILKSWAVPKGPSLDPSVKRLAVEVEDHPLAYADFEGEIAHGYGKGHVECFDRGVWSTPDDPQAQLRKGHLAFELFGSRLRGGWHLVRSHRRERQPAWFLIKASDASASKLEPDDLPDASRQSAPPHRSRAARSTRAKSAREAGAMAGARAQRIDAGFFAPELATLRSHPPAGDEWLHETKWDGYRILATIHDGDIGLWSRNGKCWNARLPDILQALQGLGLDSARLDGELVVLDETGRSDFNALQKTLSGDIPGTLTYMLFDLVHLDGQDLSCVPLHQRKRLLEHVLKDATAPLAMSTHQRGGGAEAYAQAVAQQQEGIVCKRADSPYQAGRSGDWLKIKRQQADEFAVVGYTLPKGQRRGISALLLARPDARTRSGWRYAGRVGSGFTQAQLRQLGDALDGQGQRHPSVPGSEGDLALRQARWLAPRAVVEVYYRGIGNHGLLRQPSLKTMRNDKSASDLLDSDRTGAGHAGARHNHAKRNATSRRNRNAAVALTHPDRVVFPDGGYTKRDVADYYDRVMDWFLPGVRGRPTSLLRCPEGTAQACFFQKHVTGALRHTDVRQLAEEDGKRASYLCPRTAQAIRELVQLGTLEFHPWGAPARRSSHADTLVLDLDPGPRVAWSRVVAAARLLRTLLAAMQLQSFVRTTGGKGLHVVVPLRPAVRWPRAKAFARAFAESLARAHPDEFTATASKASRRGRIYLDYLRNARGSTSVASYSLRARPGAPAAVPLRWEELGRVKSGHQYTIESVPRRLASLHSDPWAGFDEVRQDLSGIDPAVDEESAA